MDGGSPTAAVAAVAAVGWEDAEGGPENMGSTLRKIKPLLHSVWGALPLQRSAQGGCAAQQPSFDDVREACLLQALEPELVAHWPLPRDLVRRILALACPLIRV